ncbi:WD40-repeat-containing domain protein [Dissophora ornata]|nr:WD40-repeat-containing domain protein [Dissophora ornata]
MPRMRFNFTSYIFFRLHFSHALTLEPKVHNSFQFSRSVTEVEWSPDGKYMLVNLGIDLNHLNYSPRLNLIEVASGETVIVQKESEGTRNINASGIGWLMDSKRFLTFQPDGTAYVWNLNGDITQEFDLDLKIHTCKMVPGQDAAIVSTKDGKVVIFTLEDGQIRLLTTLEDQPTAMRISPDLHYVALPMKSDKNLCRQAQILILDFHSGTLLRTLASESFFNEDFVIMPSFFGPNYTILCTGSENGTVNYWDIETGEFIMAREEHSQHTGSTVFHPSIPGFMASCGDDCHIFLWVTKDLGRELQEEDEKWLNSRRNSVLPIDIKKGW